MTQLLLWPNGVHVETTTTTTAMTMPCYDLKSNQHEEAGMDIHAACMLCHVTPTFAHIFLLRLPPFPYSHGLEMIRRENKRDRQSESANLIGWKSIIAYTMNPAVIHDSWRTSHPIHHHHVMAMTPKEQH
jgi:hypothetical protein